MSLHLNKIMLMCNIMEDNPYYEEYRLQKALILNAVQLGMSFDRAVLLTELKDKEILDLKKDKEFMHQTSNGHPMEVEDYIFPVSTKTGEGLESLKSAIHERLVAKGFRTPFKIQQSLIY